MIAKISPSLAYSFLVAVLTQKSCKLFGAELEVDAGDGDMEWPNFFEYRILLNFTVPYYFAETQSLTKNIKV